MLRCKACATYSTGCGRSPIGRRAAWSSSPRTWPSTMYWRSGKRCPPWREVHESPLSAVSDVVFGTLFFLRLGAKRLPQQARAHGGRLRRRRDLRRARPGHRDPALEAARPAGHRREQARRRHDDRGRLRRKVGPGRLQHLAAGHHHARHQQHALLEAALRLDEGLQLRGDGRLHAAHAGRAPEHAGGERAGADRAPEGESRQAFVRLVRQRDHRASLGRDAESRRRRRRAPCPLQRQQPGDAGDPRRRGDVRVLDHAAGDLEFEGRQAARTGRDHAQARGRGPRGADDDRGRAAELRDRALFGHSRPQGNGPRARAQAERRVRESGRVARDEAGMAEPRRRPDRDDARGVRGRDGARDREAGSRGQGVGGKARVRLLPQHSRYDFRPLPERKPYAWPLGRRLAFTVTTNIEWFAFGTGLGHAPAKTGEPQTHRNYAWRDYGNRIGVWRLFELLDELGLPAGHCTNSLVYDYAPQITDAIRGRGDELIAHGRSNAENLLGLWQPDEERMLREVTETIRRRDGRAPAGWFGAGAYESAHTPDLLKELGYRYLMDWPMDDQPVWLATRSGPLLSVPYPIETDDAQAIIHRKWSAATFADAVVDQFDEMLAQSERHALVMNVSLHPYVFGQPFRLRRLRSALAHCQKRPGVWYCRPGEIAEHCYSLGERVT